MCLVLARQRAAAVIVATDFWCVSLLLDELLLDEVLEELSVELTTLALCAARVLVGDHLWQRGQNALLQLLTGLLGCSFSGLVATGRTLSGATKLPFVHVSGLRDSLLLGLVCRLIRREINLGPIKDEISGLYL